MKSWMQSSKRDVYLGAYLNGSNNCLKGIINRPVLFFNTYICISITQQHQYFNCNRQKGSTKCGYYVMHWMSTIILGSFRNNLETYFNDVRPLEAERLKTLRIQWAQYYLKVKNQT
ncbi:hypothetical protein HKD37_15G043051 [Glycine soja]